MQHLHERARAADLADLRIRIAHLVENLEQMTVRTTKFVDRHGKTRLAPASAAASAA